MISLANRVLLIGFVTGLLVWGGTLLPSMDGSAQGKDAPAAPAKVAMALSIGLNSVDPGHYNGWSGDLQACEFDAEDMESIAKACGFQTTKLLTKNATREKVITEIKKAAKALKGGDTFMISYSGHGGQVPDQNGDETDNQDETWCLYDGELIDDELAEQWATFEAGVRILAFSDSCHSGSVTKAHEYARFVEAVPTNHGDAAILKQKFQALVNPDVGRLARAVASPTRSMPQNIAAGVFRKNRDFYEKIGKAVPSQRKSVQATTATVLLISACQDNQEALDGTFNGYFTGTLKIIWAGGRFTGTYRDFQGAILARMQAYQSPNYFVTGKPNPQFEQETPFTK